MSISQALARGARASLGALCATLFVAASATAISAQDFPELRFKHASGWPSALYTTKPSDFFAKRVDELSGGKIKVQNFFGGALGNHPEVLDLVAKGAVDLGTVVPGYFTSALPFSAMTNSLSATFPEGSAVMRAARTLETANPSMQAELERNNIVPLIRHYLPNFRLICTSSITTMAELSGKKIRTYGNYFPLLLQQLQATPVNVLPEDAYESLKRGSLDCYSGNYSTLVAYKLHEVAKFIIDVDLGAINAFWVAMNREQFAALPQNVQDLLIQAGDEATEYLVSLTQETEDASLKTMTDGGANLVPFAENDALRAATPDMYSVWIDEMAKNGLGDEARAYVEQLKAALAAQG